MFQLIFLRVNVIKLHAIITKHNQHYGCTCSYSACN